MPADTGGPAAGLAVFGQRSFLEKEPAIRMKKPKMDGAVEQTAGVDFGARGRANDTILRINEVKDLFGWRHRVGARRQDRAPRRGGRG